MTAVLFKFSHPDGTPVVDAPFLVTTRKPSFDETLNNGIQVSGDVEGVTDAQGEATLELMAGFATYYLLMDQPGAVAGEDGCVAGLRYRFMVVESSTTVRVEDLIVTTPTWSRPWDETALQIILDAKIASIAAADRADEAAVAADASELAAKTSEDNAKLSEDAAKASELVSIDKAGQASASQLAAKASEDAAKVSEDASKVSELAAAVSADFAAGAVVDMQAQVDEATLQAGIATGAATAATDNAALTAADRVATSADAVATEADKVATAADVVTITGLKTDVTALKDETLGYRNEAMAAVGTLGAVIQDGGPIDLSGGAYPAAPIVSTMWKVTVGGTVPGPQGDTYGIGDTLFYAQDQDLFYKIDNTENVSSVAGKTGVVVLNKGDVGLTDVDNTADINKPVSTAQQTALDLKIDKTSIVDDLTSTDATKVLSAKQGKSLYDLIQANNVTLVVYEFLATAGQTVFSGADTNGLSLLYTPGTGTILLRNGVQLDRGDDYTATSGSSVTVAQACDLNDLIQVMAFGTFSVANHYTKPEEDALLLTKASKSDTDTKFADRYTKAEDDALFAAKVDKATYAQPNLIHNGDGSVNQRAYVSGTASIGPNQLTLDRWKVVTTGQSLTYTNDTYGRTMTAPAGGLAQVIEASAVEGGTYTPSWTGAGTLTINGVAAPKGVSLTLPAMTAVTCVMVGAFKYLKLEKGAIATPFVIPEPGAELIKCMRFARLLNVAAIGSVQSGLGPNNLLQSFNPPMRAAPVVTVVTPPTMFDGTNAGGTFTTIGSQNNTTTSIRISPTGLVGGTYPTASFPILAYDGVLLLSADI